MGGDPTSSYLRFSVLGLTPDSPVADGRGKQVREVVGVVVDVVAVVVVVVAVLVVVGVVVAAVLFL